MLDLKPIFERLIKYEISPREHTSVQCLSPLDNPQHAEIAFPHSAKGKNRRNEKEKTEGLNPALQQLHLSEKNSALFLSVKGGETSLRVLNGLHCKSCIGAEVVALAFNILAASNHYINSLTITNIIN